MHKLLKQEMTPAQFENMFREFPAYVLASQIGVSRKTVESWRRSPKVITGPSAIALWELNRVLTLGEGVTMTPTEFLLLTGGRRKSED